MESGSLWWAPLGFVNPDQFITTMQRPCDSNLSELARLTGVKRPVRLHRVRVALVRMFQTNLINITEKPRRGTSEERTCHQQAGSGVGDSFLGNLIATNSASRSRRSTRQSLCSPMARQTLATAEEQPGDATAQCPPDQDQKTRMESGRERPRSSRALSFCGQRVP